MSNNTKISLICNIVAAVCFLIASIACFVGGDSLKGCLFAVITAAQIVLGIIQIRFMIKNRR